MTTKVSVRIVPGVVTDFSRLPKDREAVCLLETPREGGDPTRFVLVHKDGRFPKSPDASLKVAIGPATSKRWIDLDECPVLDVSFNGESMNIETTEGKIQIKRSGSGVTINGQATKVVLLDTDLLF